MTKMKQVVGAVLVVGVLVAAGWATYCVWRPSKSAGIVSVLPPVAPPKRAAPTVHSIEAILAAHSSLSPQLSIWAASFDAGEPANAPELGQLVAQCDMSAMECLQIGVIAAAKDEIPVAEVWISAGAERAKTPLADTDHDDQTARPLITALGHAQDRLAGDQNAGPILEQINAIIMRFDRANEWDQTPEWARLHYGEALIMEGRFVDAQKATDGMNLDVKSNAHWTDQQKQELRSMTARIPFDPSAKSPRDVIAAHIPTPTKLLDWANNWQNSKSHVPSNVNPALIQMATSSLCNLIRECGLNALECLRISRMLSDANDPYSAETFAAIGADRATAELGNLAPNDRSVLPVINALEKAEDPLWEAPGDAVARGVTLEKITAQLMRFDREQNWDQRIEWARIGHGEALYMEQRYAESLTEAEQLAVAAASDTHFTNDQKIGIEWLEGLNLYETHKYQEAIPHLEKTATYKSFHHSKDAWPLWAISLAKTGNKAEADRVFDEWIHDNNPPLEAASRALGIMQGQG